MKFLCFAAILLVLMTFVVAQPPPEDRKVNDEVMNKDEFDSMFKSFQQLIPNFSDLLKNAQLGVR